MMMWIYRLTSLAFAGAIFIRGAVHLLEFPARGWNSAERQFWFWSKAVIVVAFVTISVARRRTQLRARVVLGAAAVALALVTWLRIPAYQAAPWNYAFRLSFGEYVEDLEPFWALFATILAAAYIACAPAAANLLKLLSRASAAPAGTGSAKQSQ
jgi:hypothetical protein